MNAIEILENLLAGKKVSRWDCLRTKGEARRLIKENPEKYSSVEIKFEGEIIIAKESI
jgi:hypothetical protein